VKRQDNPLVSIGMPVYNGAHFLRGALDSLLKQEFEDFEILISDNASTDDTRSICTEYARRDERIQYLPNDTNIGALKNFNRVLSLARGKYFMWASYDDLWEPAFVSKLVSALEANPPAVLAFCSCYRMDPEGKILRANRLYKRLSHPNRLVRAQRYIWFPPREGRAMVFYGLMRTAVVKEMGGIKAFEQWDSSDDMFVLRLLLKGDFAFTEEFLFRKRDVPSSPTFNKWGVSNWFAYYRDYRRVVKESDLQRWEKQLLVLSIVLHQFRYIIKVLYKYSRNKLKNFVNPA
jgi:glycosyltransferase involved in cell wall biosynthesis